MDVLLIDKRLGGVFGVNTVFTVFDDALVQLGVLVRSTFEVGAVSAIALWSSFLAASMQGKHRDGSHGTEPATANFSDGSMTSALARSARVSSWKVINGFGKWRGGFLVAQRGRVGPGYPVGHRECWGPIWIPQQ